MPKRNSQPRRLQQLSPSNQRIELDFQDEDESRTLANRIQHLKWKSWLHTPEALVDILRDPTLLKPPGIRNSKLHKMLEELRSQ